MVQIRAGKSVRLSNSPNLTTNNLEVNFNTSDSESLIQTDVFKYTIFNSLADLWFGSDSELQFRQEKWWTPCPNGPHQHWRI